jgi:1-acyl-sn-glycerol-3-phosphate acyltransferase
LTAYYFRGKRGTVFLHKKLLKVPMLGWWLKRLDVIPVIPPTSKYESVTLDGHRQKTFSEKITNWLLPPFVVSKREMAEINILAKREALETLAQGKSLVVFPEGTRTSNGQMKSFEETAFNIAKKSNVPVVPIAFIGSYEAKPKWRHFIKPTDIVIRIKDPFDGSTMSAKEFAEKTQHVIQEMIDE